MTRRSRNVSFLAAVFGACAFLGVDAFLVVTPSFSNARQRQSPHDVTSTADLSSSSSSSSSSRLYLNIGGWFGRGKKHRQEDNAENLGGVASIVDSMGDLKTAQRVGQLTDSLVKELATTMAEGTAMDGKVKVTFDCQQKPVSVTIEEGFLSEADATTVSNAVTTAMQDAHAKSIERMDEKMKSLYAELGMASV